MERLSLHIENSNAAQPGCMVFDVPDLQTALVVTDINMTSGTAEIWQNQKRLARLSKAAGKGAPFWEVA